MIKLKIIFHIPFPLKNHFYKGRRISIKKHWFCCSCQNFFSLLPDQGNLKMSNIYCPHCNSSSYMWHTDIFKAKIDNKPTEEVLNICNTIIAMP